MLFHLATDAPFDSQRKEDKCIAVQCDINGVASSDYRKLLRINESSQVFSMVMCQNRWTPKTVASFLVPLSTSPKKAYPQKHIASHHLALPCPPASRLLHHSMRRIPIWKALSKKTCCSVSQASRGVDHELVKLDTCPKAVSTKIGRWRNKHLCLRIGGEIVCVRKLG